MTTTEHWNRLDQRIRKLWPQEVLEQEKLRLDEAGKLYLFRIGIHIKNGASINRNHDQVFRFIIDQSLKEIQKKIDTLDILENVCLTNFPG